MSQKVEIRYEGPGETPWRVYWSGTAELADPGSFESIEAAAPAARHALGMDSNQAGRFTEFDALRTGARSY